VTVPVSLAEIKAWDCYSPVALVLWRAADFAEAGNVGSPIHDAAWDLRLGAFGGPACELAAPVKHRPRPIEHLGWAIHLRNLAEFGPAGRPK